MSNKLKWNYYVYKRYVCRVKKRLTGKYFKHYANRELKSPIEGNELIKDLLSSQKPCAICRFGLTEMSILAYREGKKVGKLERNNDNNLCMLSGFFPNDTKQIDKFHEMMIDEIKEIDFLGIWYNRAEEYIVDQYMKRTSVGNISSLEPYVFCNPWSSLLKGKKVLVVHPFEESIKKQYTVHDKLFEDKSVLPYFSLYTIKAVQTISEEQDSRFNTWFEALEYMKQQMNQIDYDVAIIGCGAYGMPLAIHAKQMGKQAIHMGGATQILFGIKGNRWDDNPVISKLYNEYWTRPGENEKVKQANRIEEACYW